MRKFFVCLLLIGLLLVARGVGPGPALTADAAATTRAAATSLAATLAFPPSATMTLTETLTPSPTLTRTPRPTRTRFHPTKTVDVAYTGCFTPTGTTDDIAPFKIENLTKSKVVVFINGTTRTGEHPINCSFTVKSHNNVIFTIWWGDYTYMVQILGRTTFQGSFWVNDVDKATMRVTDKGIHIGPFP